MMFSWCKFIGSVQSSQSRCCWRRVFLPHFPEWFVVVILSFIFPLLCLRTTMMTSMLMMMITMMLMMTTLNFEDIVEKWLFHFPVFVVIPLSMLPLTMMISMLITKMIKMLWTVNVPPSLSRDLLSLSLFAVSPANDDNNDYDNYDGGDVSPSLCRVVVILPDVLVVAPSPPSLTFVKWYIRKLSKKLQRNKKW